jgi:hypothetical protein
MLRVGETESQGRPAGGDRGYPTTYGGTGGPPSGATMEYRQTHLPVQRLHVFPIGQPFSAQAGNWVQA